MKVIQSRVGQERLVYLLLLLPSEMTWLLHNVIKLKALPKFWMGYKFYFELITLAKLPFNDPQLNDIGLPQVAGQELYQL